MDYLQMLISADNAIFVGLGFIVLGIFISRAPNTKYYIHYDNIRQMLIKEASAFGQDKRLSNLQGQEASISRMPYYGKLLMLSGAGLIVIGVTFKIFQ